MVKDGDYRAPDPQPVPDLTVKDVMPTGEKDQIDQNPNLKVNVKGATNLVDFVLVQDRHTTMANGKKPWDVPTQ